MKWSKVFAAAACLLVAGVALAAQVPDGEKFNVPTSGQWRYVARTVDSTGTKAGRRDSFVYVTPVQYPSIPLTVGGVRRSDTTSFALGMTYEGYLQTSEANKDRDNYSVQSWSDTISSAGAIPLTWSTAKILTAMSFTADSTGPTPIQCNAYRRFTIGLRLIPGIAAVTDTFNTTYKLAIQIRKHSNLTGDSASTFVWTSWNGATSFVADSIAVMDTTGHHAAIGAGGATAGPLTRPWRGERVVYFNPRYGSTMGALDSGNDWYATPDGIAMDLVDSKGQSFWGYGISARWRLLDIIGRPLAEQGKTTSAPRVVVTLMMGS